MNPFTPCYVFESELQQYGLPSEDCQGDIMNLVQMASSLVDIECGRVDGDGNGSLVYTTYVQRLLLGTRNRNLVYVSSKPIVALDATTQSALILAASGSSGGNFYYTGFTPNTLMGPAQILSGIIGVSGRYGYTRQDMSIAYPDLQAFINPLNLVTMFGGPAPWVPIDVGNLDYDAKTGECWIPAGLQLQRYSEILIQYNSGYDPRQMPRAIKYVTAAIVKNAIVKGGGTTGLISMNMGRGAANATFAPNLLDVTMDTMLQPYRTVRAI